MDSVREEPHRTPGRICCLGEYQPCSSDTARNGEIVYADHGPVGVLVTEQHVGQTTEPTLSDLSAALIIVYGTDYGIHSPTSISQFTDAARQPASYRRDAC
jgi:hypothetical protein